jgi:hypothetical protein
MEARQALLPDYQRSSSSSYEAGMAHLLKQTAYEDRIPGVGMGGRFENGFLSFDSKEGVAQMNALSRKRESLKHIE